MAEVTSGQAIVGALIIVHVLGLLYWVSVLSRQSASLKAKKRE